MKIRYWLLMLGLLGSSPLATAQASRTLDSLLTYLRMHPATDTTYLKVMDKVAIELIYKKADYARADSLSRQMAEVASKAGNWTKLVAAHRNRAAINLLKADYEQAMVFFQKTLETAEQHNLPRQLIYGAMCNLIIGHDKLQHNEEVIQLATRAIEYQERYQLKPRSPLPPRLIGEALVRLGRQQQAIPYYQQAGAIFRELGDERGTAIFENQTGDFYLELKQPQPALAHFRQSLQLAERLQFELLQADALDGVANALRLLKRPAEAMPYAHRALAIAQKQDNKLGTSTSYGTMGQLYQAQLDYPNAETYLKKAIALAEKNGYKDDLKRYTQALADLFAEQNKYQQAYVVQLKNNKLTDSTTAVRTNAEVQRLLAKYEADKRETQIRLLQNERQLQQQEADRTRWQRNALLAGGALLVLLGAATTAWLLNRARVRRLQEAQQIRKQIAHDLHDEVGSTLSSISLLSGMVNDLIAQKRPESAERAIQKINTDARQILEAIDEIIWTINPGNDSLQRVALRLKEYAQPLMESKNIAFSLVDDPGLDHLPISMDVRRNLYLVAKEAINNLIKYSEATQATMRFEHQNNQLKVVIEDNGRGFDVNQASLRTGQQSMRDRASAMGGSLTVQSAVGSGTKLELVVGQ
ncbi:Sensor protein uhpB [Fibrella aestuarina BUZ 2]|uniref:histidine kinase n=1 Tax=Fibrella aestuarina BUZ 2 TaxID=1166018 RepID=I0KDA2_9BACT|nr:tetratricopeptide repeat protein [Fibrella aestuarina]CCH02105.1 Sensor protein uhpB [Fibrella aestuarina BUZ 2]